jgi:hypothetical protein
MTSNLVPAEFSIQIEESDEPPTLAKDVCEDASSQHQSNQPSVEEDVVEETVDIGDGFLVDVLPADPKPHQAAARTDKEKTTTSAPSRQKQTSRWTPATLPSRVGVNTSEKGEQKGTKLLSTHEAILASCVTVRRGNNARLTSRTRPPTNLDNFAWKTTEDAKKNRPSPSILLRMPNVPPLPGTSKLQKLLFISLLVIHQN